MPLLPTTPVIGESLRGLRAHAGFVTLLALPLLIVALLDGALSLAALAQGNHDSPNVIGLLLQVVQAWLSVTLSTNIVRLVLLGRDSMKAPLRQALRLGRMELVVFGISLALTFAAALAAGLPIWLIAIWTDMETGPMALAVLAAFVIAGWLVMRLSLSIPAAVAGHGLGGLRVSWRITKGHGWRLIGLFLLATLIVLGLTIGLSLAGGLAAGAIGVVAALIAGWDLSTAGGIAALGTTLSAMAAQLAGTVFLMAVAAVAFRILGTSPQPTEMTAGPDEAAEPPSPPSPGPPPDSPAPPSPSGRIPRTGVGPPPPPDAG